MYSPDMVRAQISKDVEREVKALTDPYFNVPDTKVSFEDRVRILAEKHRELQNQDSDFIGGSDTV